MDDEQVGMGRHLDNPHRLGIRHDRSVLIVGWVVIGAGLAGVALRIINSTPNENTAPRGILATLAIGMVIAAPGAMALLARYDRPVLVLPAAIICIPTAFLSFAGVLLPLLVPAYFLLRAYSRHRRQERWIDAVVAVALLALWLITLVMLLSDTSRIEYRSAYATHSVELPTYMASAGSVVALSAGLALAWWATTPRAGSEPAPKARHKVR